MNHPFLLVNIGNTHCVIALWDGAAGAREQLLTADLVTGAAFPSLPARYPDAPRIGASVVPAAAAALAPLEIHWISAASPLGLDLSAVDAGTIGADRLANAAALAHEGPIPALLIDFGTAISSVVVDRRRRLLGGFILPGRHLARQALTRGTAQLPDVPLLDRCPNAIGNHTAAAICGGIEVGILGAVERLITAARNQTESDLHALATGGDRDYFLANIADLAPATEEFTLRGLAAIAGRCAR